MPTEPGESSSGSALSQEPPTSRPRFGVVPELIAAAPALNAAGGCKEESSELLAPGVAPESEAPSQACSSDDDELEYLQLQACDLQTLQRPKQRLHRT